MQNNLLRTATVTWITYPNFGTYLQAYALQQTVLRLGYDNRIIDDCRFVQSAPWRARLGRLKRWLLRKPPVKIQNPAFLQFRKQYIKVDEQWRNYADLNNRYDLFLCGSDQIWSPYVRKINPYYYAIARIYSDGLGLSKSKLPPLAIVNPYHSERIKAQKGVFTVFPYYREQEGDRTIREMGINPGAMDSNKIARECLFKIDLHSPQEIARSEGDR